MAKGGFEMTVRAGGGIATLRPPSFYSFLCDVCDFLFSTVVTRGEVIIHKNPMTHSK